MSKTPAHRRTRCRRAHRFFGDYRAAVRANRAEATVLTLTVLTYATADLVLACCS